MKICAISDLHGYLPGNIPEADVLCICGDIVPLDYQRDYEASIAWFCLEFIPWTDSLPVDKVIFIAGNHDYWLEKAHLKEYHEFEQTVNGDEWVTMYRFDSSPTRVLKKLLPGPNKGKHKLIYLCDNSYEYKGITFYGTPWCPDLNKWAFYRSHEDLITLFNRIPKKVDILLSHAPSSIGKVGEILQKDAFNYGERYGSTELAASVSDRDIKWHLSGHVHSGNHTPENINGTNFVCVSLKDENYKVAYKPFVFNDTDS